MFRGLFDPENGLFSTLSLLVDLVGLSLFWAFLCQGIVTAGPATAALYYTVVKVFRQGEKNTFSLFFRAFVRELKPGCLATLCFVPVVALLALLGRWYNLAALDGGGWQLAYAYFIVVALIPVALALWLFPMLGRFQFSRKQLFSTALSLAVAHLPTTLLLLLLTAGAVWLVLCFLPLIFLVPTLWAILLTFPLERAFARHLPEDGSEG